MTLVYKFVGVCFDDIWVHKFRAGQFKRLDLAAARAPRQYGLVE